MENPRSLGHKTSQEEMKKYGPAWGINPVHVALDRRIQALIRKGMSPHQVAQELGTTSTYVKGVLSRNPQYVEARPSFEYAHETIVPMDKIRKAHPDATIRSVTSGNHVLRIAYWNHTDGKHKQSELQSILHPREESKSCAFMASIRKSGRLKELLEKGRLPITRNVSPFSGKVQYLSCPVCSSTNPVSRVGSLRCMSCGTPLSAVKVKRNRKRR